MRVCMAHVGLRVFSPHIVILLLSLSVPQLSTFVLLSVCLESKDMYVDIKKRYGTNQGFLICSPGLATHYYEH